MRYTLKDYQAEAVATRDTPETWFRSRILDR